MSHWRRQEKKVRGGEWWDVVENRPRMRQMQTKNETTETNEGGKTRETWDEV